MKKIATTSLALALVLSLLISVGFTQSLAVQFGFPLPVSQEEWDAIWTEIDAKNSVVALTPGSDETQRNFAWQSAKDAKDPIVTLSVNADLSDAVIFSGASIYNRGTGLLTNYVTAKNLVPGTMYYYQCSTSLDQSAIYSFTVQTVDSFKTVMFSDIHVKSDESLGIDEKSSGMVWNRALESALTREPDTAFVMAAGDNANVGAAREYLGLFAPPALKSIPLATCVGNHDKKAFNYKYYMNNPNAYQSLAGSIQGDEYWFRYGDVLFLVFDTTHGSGYDHYQFAKAACEANEDAKWRIAMYHHDLHGSNYDRTAEDRALQLIFDPILSRFDVDAVFSGHNHRYARTHMMDNGKIVQDTTGQNEVVDPKGMVYIGTTSVNHVSTHIINPEDITNPEIAAFYGGGETTYNVLSFEGGKFNVQVREVSDGDLVDEFTIVKTGGNGPKTSEKSLLSYLPVLLLSTIYSIFDKLVDVLALFGIIDMP